MFLKIKIKILTVELIIKIIIRHFNPKPGKVLWY